MIEKNDIWKSFSIFQSAANTQKYLKQCYEQQGQEEAMSLSYDNCYPFIYYLEHARTYYQQAGKSPLSIQPVLIFYGMVQLLKACILTIDPHYPSHSSVLAHGVSTRKRKKKNYEFLNDEVKIQKEGLFNHFSENMFHVKQLEGEKYSMEFLIKHIPEMHRLFQYSQGQSYGYKVKEVESGKYAVPEKILDDFKMTDNRLIQYLKSQLEKVNVTSITHSRSQQQFIITTKSKLSRLFSTPFYFHMEEKSFYLPSDKRLFTSLNEPMIHYLLLYNLSMICRYETEWWSELLHTYQSMDYPFIQHFLALTLEKIPILLFEYLYDRHEQ